MHDLNKTSDECIRNIMNELFGHNKNGVKSIIHELFLDLKNNDMLHKKIMINKKLEHVKEKMHNSTKIIAIFCDITTTDQWVEYQLQNKKWFHTCDLELIYSSLYIQYLLENIEYDRMLLLNILNIKKINEFIKKNNDRNKYINKNSNLSCIAKVFDIIFHKSKYEKLLYSPLRNAIAHNDYFWKQNMLVYNNKNEEHMISYVDIKNNILETSCIGLLITREIREWRKNIL